MTQEMMTQEEYAFEAREAVRAWRMVEETWPGGMPEPDSLINVNGWTGRATGCTCSTCSSVS